MDAATDPPDIKVMILDDREMGWGLHAPPRMVCKSDTDDRGVGMDALSDAVQSTLFRLALSREALSGFGAIHTVTPRAFKQALLWEVNRTLTPNMYTCRAGTARIRSSQAYADSRRWGTSLTTWTFRTRGGPGTTNRRGTAARGVRRLPQTSEGASSSRTLTR